MPKDKVLHLAVGFIFSIVMALAGFNALQVLFLAAALGVAKEVSDYIQNKFLAGRRHVEILDVIATFLGAVPVAAFQIFLSL